jgi:peroxiredoxin
MKKLSLRDWIITVFVGGLILVVTYIWLSPAGVQKAPDLKVNVFNSSQTIDLKALHGRPVLVTFWATSCSGCIKEMPHLIELYKELAPKGLEIIGIAMSYDRPDHILEMQKRKQIPYPIVYDGVNEASQAFGGIRLTPTTFLINPKGQIVKQKLGEMDMKLLHAQILTMLNSSKKSS